MLSESAAVGPCPGGMGQPQALRVPSVFRAIDGSREQCTYARELPRHMHTALHSARNAKCTRRAPHLPANGARTTWHTTIPPFLCSQPDTALAMLSAYARPLALARLQQPSRVAQRARLLRVACKAQAQGKEGDVLLRRCVGFVRGAVEWS
jgi:hypothetical protein